MNFVLLKTLHFLGGLANSSFYIYASLLYYAYFDLDKKTIGALLAMNPFISLFAIPTIMYLVERRKKGSLKLALIICAIIGSTVYGFTATLTSSSASKIPLLFIISFLTSCTLSSLGSILDCITLIMLGDQRSSYGRQRLFGSFSWGLGSMLTGFLIDETKSYLMIVYSYLICISLFLLAATLIPLNLANGSAIEESTPLLPNEIETSIPRHEEVPAAAASPSLLQSIFQSHTILFFSSTVLTGMVFSVLNSFVFIYLSNTWKLPSSLLGLTTLLSILFEIPIFFYSNWFLHTIGTFRMIVLSHVLLFIRLLVYCVLPNLLEPSKFQYLILFVEVIHGAAFGLFWIAGMEYIQEISPPSLKSTFISLYSTLFNNAGGIFGNFIGKYNGTIKNRRVALSGIRL
jgi:MFS family permease